MKVYISGPMRGHKAFNFPAFDAAEAKLMLWGHETFSPARRDRHTHPDVRWYCLDGTETDLPGFDIRAALAADCEFICREAEAICVLPGWSRSRGALAEVKLAMSLDLPVIPLDQWELAWRGPVLGWAAGENPSDDQLVEVTLPQLQAELIASLDAEEVRSVSSTGAMKGMKLARFDLLPVHALTEVAKHYGRTAQKYPPNNWRAGYEWSKSYAALMRHATQWWSGEDNDNDPAWDSPSPHLAAVAWHALTLLEYAKDHPEMDDRCTTPGTKSPTTSA